MKKVTVLGILILLPFFSSSQNLVPNPSFESYNEPFCGIMFPADFESTVDDWLNPNGSSPALYFTNLNDSCYNLQPTNNYPGPIGQKGTQLPRTGEVMAGLWLYTFEGLNQRQYVQTPLVNPLEMGQQYIVEFYVSHADYIEFMTSNIQAYLSINPEGSSSTNPIEVNPQIEAENFILDQEEWVRIADTILVESPYQYLTIGNFKNDAETDLLANDFPSGEPGTYGAYYFIDDVSVSLYLPVGVNEIESSDYNIYPTLADVNLNIFVQPTRIGSSYAIANLQGQVVIEGVINESTSIIDLTNLAHGMYSFNLKANGAHSRKIFIKG